MNRATNKIELSPQHLRAVDRRRCIVDQMDANDPQAVLNIGQPTISEYVSQLEGRLGVRLCERGRGGFRLTERGEALYLSSKRLLVVLDDFRSDAELIRRKLGGWLNLGLIDNTIGDTGTGPCSDRSATGDFIRGQALSNR